MSQQYSDPARADEQYALPDLEAFYNYGPGSPFWNGDADMAEGWYFWYCFPGCLPDSDPMGPYASEQLAVEAARGE